MRKGICVPMMTLCLLLCGCGQTETAKADAQAFRQPYQDMAGCVMEAEVACGAGSEQALTFTLRCDYDPAGETVVEVLAPETAAGVRAVITGEELALEYEDLVLPAGTLSAEDVSPAACLPRLMSALRDGWLLEENREDWDGEPCLRLCLDQTGQTGKVLSTLWLRLEDGTPVYGEIAVEDEIILQARFTDFQFGDILDAPE